MKSSNKYGTRKSTGRPEKLSPQFKRRIYHRVKKKTLSRSKILKSLVDAPCSTTTIRRHLNKEKIKQKKRIHRPTLTMKHKEKWLEYACQYQTMNAKEWWKVVFLDEKKFNLDCLDGFQKYWHAKSFPETTRHSGRGSLMIRKAFSSSGKLKLQFVCGWQKAADYVKMLNDLSLIQERHCLCGEEWIF